MLNLNQLKEITLNDRKIFEKYLLEHNSNISELTFTNIFSWRNVKKHKFTIYKEHLIISATDNITGKILLYQPIGTNPESMK